MTAEELHWLISAYVWEFACQHQWHAQGPRLVTVTIQIVKIVLQQASFKHYATYLEEMKSNSSLTIEINEVLELQPN